VILQALHALAVREHLLEDPDYEYKPVSWRVVLSAKGELRGILSNCYEEQAAGKKKPRILPKKELIPMQPNRSGTKAPPYFMVDNAKYVFGMPVADKALSEEDGAEKSGWFLDLVRKCHGATSDPAAGAIVAFLEQLGSGASPVVLPEGCKSNDQFAFIVEPDVDTYVHDRPAVRAFWRAHRILPGKTDDREVNCLVTGKPMSGAPLFKFVKGVPGGTPSGVALVSFDGRAFESYGWSKNQNAPISQAASEACSIALNRLLDNRYPDPRQPGQSLPGRNLRLSSDTVVCFWTARESGDELCSLFGHLLTANADEVKALYHSIWRGKQPQIDDPSAFYALTLTGTQGRAIVRGWLESTVSEVAQNLAQHFADLDIVRNTHPGKDRSLPPSFSLAALAEALSPGGDREQVPAPLITELATAAIRGTPYPLSALQRALERSRAEVGRTEWLDSNRKDARAAIIKAVLNRRRRFSPDTCHYPEVKKDMDPNANSPGYSLGRLMAVLERLQSLAINDANATVVDRFFSGASATPKAVFVRLLKNARHHARKAMDGEHGGMAFLLDRVIDELTGPFQPKTNGFPAHLDLEQQGLFVLGYHQMRKWLWMSGEERAAWESENPNAPKQYLWSKKA